MALLVRTISSFSSCFATRYLATCASNHRRPYEEQEMPKVDLDRTRGRNKGCQRMSGRKLRRHTPNESRIQTGRQDNPRVPSTSKRGNCSKISTHCATRLQQFGDAPSTHAISEAKARRLAVKACKEALGSNQPPKDAKQLECDRQPKNGSTGPGETR
jgi:hypothetical protein